jgi:teichuronic acid biosynthesis glycosyltransferase TuaC
VGAGIDPLRLLTFSTLYPNAERPHHGVFVENRLRHLVGSQPVSSTVLAPVPWFPLGHARFGDWARNARVPLREERHGLVVHHPRYPVLPKVGMLAAPWLLYQASLRAVRRLMRDGLRFDVIDAHYLYPDGVAAVWLGQRLGVPVVMTARGSDVTQIAQMAAPGRMVSAAVRAAAGVITVSSALRDGVIALGAAPERVRVLRNGVDLFGFHPPVDRGAARAALGLTRPALISVGHLIPRKGHDLTIRAMALLPEWELVVLGEGPERAGLEGLIRSLGLQDRVRLLGARPHGALAACYGAADLMVLASSREGWANVLLESMACGTAVVASDIPGNPEVVGCRDAGVVVPRSPEGIAAGVRDLWTAMPERAATRGYAEGFGWGETSAGGYAVYRGVVGS